MGRFFDTLLHRPVADAREQRLVALIENSHDVALALDEILAGLGTGEAPSEPALARVACVLDASGLDDDARVHFWQALAGRFPAHAYIQACLGDALLTSGREREAVDAFLAAFRITPALINDFDAGADLACAQGGPAWLEYQLIELRAALDAAEAADADTDTDADADADIDVRERYSELIEEYYGDAAAMADIRALGKRITALEQAGVLPQSFVRRGDWRSD